MGVGSGEAVGVSVGSWIEVEVGIGRVGDGGTSLYLPLFGSIMDDNDGEVGKGVDVDEDVSMGIGVGCSVPVGVFIPGLETAQALSVQNRTAITTNNERM
jgi:hypothetical protein